MLSTKAENLPHCSVPTLEKAYTQGEDDLRRHGWALSHHGPYPPDRNDPAQLALYHDLGLSAHQSQNTVQRWEHSMDKTVRGRSYTRTDGNYPCIFSPVAVIAQASESPEYMSIDDGIDDDITGNELIPLK